MSTSKQDNFGLKGSHINNLNGKHHIPLIWKGTNRLLNRISMPLLSIHVCQTERQSVDLTVENQMVSVY